MTGEIAAVVRGAGMRSAVASPIVVERRLWGRWWFSRRGDEPFPEDTEARLTDFTELVATAIANAESREALAELADEQAALRRVATLVAQGASPQDLFEAVAEEVGRLLPVGSATMGRYEPDGSVTTVASWSTTEAAFPTGRRWPTEGTNVAWMVLQTGQAARIDDFSAATDPIGVAAQGGGHQVGGWKPDRRRRPSLGRHDGYLDRRAAAAGHRGAPRFVHGARRNSGRKCQSRRNALEQLADEQAALRRVATLVAAGCASDRDLLRR